VTRVVLIAAMAAVVVAGCEGVGSRSRGERTGRAAGTAVSIEGCVERRNDTLVVRAVDSEEPSVAGAAAAGDPDSNGGATTHRPPAAPPQRTESSSTTADGAWHGSRIYALVGDSGSWRQFEGARVSVSGTIAPVDAPGAGTDQMQSAHGAVFASVRPAAITPRGGACPQAHRNTTDTDDPARQANPSDRPVH